MNHIELEVDAAQLLSKFKSNAKPNSDLDKNTEDKLPFRR